MPMDLSMPKDEQLTNSFENSEKLLVKENENYDEKIKPLDEVVIMPMDLSVPKNCKTHDQLTAHVSVSEKPLIKHSVMRSDIITIIRMKFFQYPFMDNLTDAPEGSKFLK